jgi:hypothetical protein
VEIAGATDHLPDRADWLAHRSKGTALRSRVKQRQTPLLAGASGQLDAGPLTQPLMTSRGRREENQAAPERPLTEATTASQRSHWRPSCWLSLPWRQRSKATRHRPETDWTLHTGRPHVHGGTLDAGLSGAA